MRKGKDEKGFGPMTTELREYTDNLKKSGETREGFEIKSQEQTSNYVVSLLPTNTYLTKEMTMFSREEIESALFDIGFERARLKTIDCNYSMNGYCNYWKFAPNSHLLKEIYMRFAGGKYTLPKSLNLSQTGKKERELARVTELLCFDCDKYSPKKKI